MGLGPYPAVSLAKARLRAERCREQVADGFDPIAERGKDARFTFGNAADRFYETKGQKWASEKTHQKWHRAMIGYCGPIRGRAVASIDTEDVLEVLSPIWAIKSDTATDIRARIEKVLDFAKAKGWRIGENPARWRGHLENILPKPSKLTRGHMSAMDYNDVPAFMGRLGQSEALAARALEFTILTAARSGEILNVGWDEIDLDRRLWTVPAGRMKGRIEHRVPLSDPAVDILARLNEARISNHIFPGQKTGKPYPPDTTNGLAAGAAGAVPSEPLLGRLPDPAPCGPGTAGSWSMDRIAVWVDHLGLSSANAVQMSAFGCIPAVCWSRPKRQFLTLNGHRDNLIPRQLGVL